MQWTTLLATLLGAAIAMGTSLVVEARRDRRDIAAEWRKTRRELYAAFLTALTQTRTELLNLAENTDMSEGERAVAARGVFARCYELRHQLELFAPREVVEPTLTYFRSVRGLRDAVGKGLTDPEWERHTEQVKHTLAVAREAMRADVKPA